MPSEKTHPERRSHGDGTFDLSDFRRLGDGVVIERGVMVFHPENIELGERVYVGHQTILKGYYKGTMQIGQGSWIGQQCFFHSAGNIEIGQNVGVGPGVRIITSAHAEEGRAMPILHSRIEFAPVVIGDDCDIGVGSTILPGATLGRGVQVGAGAVVKGSFPDYAIIAGVPARVLRYRPQEA